MKQLSIFVVAVVSAVMFCAPAFADDRVSFYGEMKARAWDKETSSGAESSYIDQRFRVGTKFRVSDDVYAEMRADYTDGKWGSDFTTNYNDGLVTRPNRGTSSAIDVDRAFLNISKEMWALRIGQQYLGLGIAEVLDANATGVKLDLKFSPVTVTGMYVKMDENGSLNDDDANDDEDLYALNINYASDAFAVNAFAATINDGTPTDNSPVAFGVHGTTSLGMVNLTAELANFSGDTNDGAIDYMGTQFYLKADAKITDAISVDAQLLYALGTTDSNEVQKTDLSNWDSFTVLSNNTGLADDFLCYVGSPAANGGSPFDPSGESAGVQGILIGGKFVPMEDLSFGGRVGYLTPEEDDATTLDSLMAYYVWAEYVVATNTKFAAGYAHVDPDVDPGPSSHSYVDGEADQRFMAQMKVNF
jgi:hypothetical protein